MGDQGITVTPYTSIFPPSYYTGVVEIRDNVRFLEIEDANARTRTLFPKTDVVVHMDYYRGFSLKAGSYNRYFEHSQIRVPITQDTNSLVSILLNMLNNYGTTSDDDNDNPPAPIGLSTESDNIIIKDINMSPLIAEICIINQDPHHRTIRTFRQGTNIDFIQPVLEETRLHFHPQMKYVRLSLTEGEGGHFPFTLEPDGTTYKRIIQQSPEYFHFPSGKTTLCVMSAALHVDSLEDPEDTTLFTSFDHFDFDSSNQKYIMFKSRVGMFNSSKDMLQSPVRNDHDIRNMYDCGIFVEYFKRIDNSGPYDQLSIAMYSRYFSGENSKLLIRVDRDSFNLDTLDGRGSSKMIFDPKYMSTFVFKFGNVNNAIISVGIYHQDNVVMFHQMEVDVAQVFNYDAWLPMRWEFDVQSNLESSSLPREGLEEVSNIQMLRGNGAVYSTHRYAPRVDQLTQNAPFRKVALGPIPQDSDDLPIMASALSYEIDQEYDARLVLTADISRNVVFGIRLSNAYTRYKTKLKSLRFIARDTALKSFRWRLVRNGKLVPCMWRANIPELLRDRARGVIYRDSRDLNCFVTPNDVYKHRMSALPVLVQSDQSGDQSCDFFGRVGGAYVDANQQQEISENSIFQLSISRCDVFAPESTVKLVDRAPINEFDFLPNLGKAYTDTGIQIYDGVALNEKIVYTTLLHEDVVMKNDVVLNEFYNVVGGDEQLCGTVLMNGEELVDVQKALPILSDVEGISDVYFLEVEHVLGSSIDLRVAVQWEEFY
jgi:hypothetical protein